MNRYRQPGEEPALQELLDDPITLALMQVDGVSLDILKPLLDSISETMASAVA